MTEALIVVAVLATGVTLILTDARHDAPVVGFLGIAIIVVGVILAIGQLA